MRDAVLPIRPPPAEEGRRPSSVAGPIRGLPPAEPTGAELASRYETAIRATGQVFYFWDAEIDRILKLGPNCEEVLGYRTDELVGGLGCWVGLIHPDDRAGFMARALSIPTTGKPYRHQYRMLHKDGRRLVVRDEGRCIKDGSGKVTQLVGFVTDITDQVRTEELWRERESTLLNFFDGAPACLFVTELLDDDVRILSANPAAIVLMGRPEAEILDHTMGQLGYPRAEIDLWIGRYRECLETGRPATYELAHEAPSGPRSFSATLAPIAGLPSGRPRFGFIGEDVTARKRVEEELRAAARERQQMMDAIPDILYVLDRDGRLASWNLSLERATGWTPEELRGRPAADFFRHDVGARIAEGIALEGLQGRAAVDATLVGRNEATAPYHFVSAPLRDDAGRVVGLAGVGRDIRERLALEAALREQAEAVDTINRLGLALLGEYDPARLAGSICDAAILLSGARSGSFVPLFDDGNDADPTALWPPFHSENAPPQARRRPGPLHPAMCGPEPIRVDDVDADARFRDLAAGLDFLGGPPPASLLVVPVKARSGAVLGEIVLAHDLPSAFGERAERLVCGLAAQAAVALDNARLVESLQRSRDWAESAYDQTIVGWALALDLRDHETEGHSRRVTELTVRLARALGMSDEELVHVRRGALLHDIGKMGVPDRILLKPVPLDEAEWEIMKRHPTYAYEMLRPIAFLGRALDIPYGHHERWDGAGYPRGLRELQIPLAARIFAAVDVYDALTHDRPYREAWPPDRALGHIRSLAGTHLDPQVVAAFPRVVGGRVDPGEPSGRASGDSRPHSRFQTYPAAPASRA
ncbi:HD domain-containing phosphohydrolase [Paludisphaera mucosa]|uniref:PAS domain S-box protein n=1 Tax=Paludisphaera mucosa TaxID=3030827 RepID=A0ABT6FD93_9BACT|nr:PAS domain S-box protein [Paludisphaera mucosa]